MSSISTVAPPASTTTSTPQPPLKTIIRIVAHGSPPLDLSNYAMHQPIEDGVPINGGVRQGSRSGALANNPTVKAAEAFIQQVEQSQKQKAMMPSQIASQLWQQFGPGIMSALQGAGQAFINYLQTLPGGVLADPRSSQPTQSTALSPADQTLAKNLMNTANQAGVASFIPGAVSAVFSAMQSSGAIVDTTA